jgi:hypothetical protein
MSMPARQPLTPGSDATPSEDRREHRRFTGPFDGCRVDLVETPVRIYDLSRGGCFISSTHHQKPGIALTLRFDLPGAGTITVQAQTLPRQSDFGYAVRFTSIDPDDAMRFQLALTRMEEQG